MAETPGVGAWLDTLVEETSILDSIEAYLEERSRLDMLHIEQLRMARSKLSHELAHIDERSPVVHMREDLLNLLDQEILSREEAAATVRDHIQVARRYRLSKRSHTSLRASITKFNEANLAYKAAETDIRQGSHATQTSSVQSDYSTQLRLPVLDLAYRRTLVEVNRCRVETTRIRAKEFQIILHDHQDYIEQVKKALLKAAYARCNLQYSLVTFSNRLIECLPGRSAFAAVDAIASQEALEERHWAPVTYMNYTNQISIDSPVWGVSNSHLIAVGKEGKELSHWIAEYYVKRQRLHDSTKDKPDTLSVPDAVVELAFKLEANFSLLNLETSLDYLSVDDVKCFLQFVLLNLPEPVLHIDDATFLRYKGGWPRRTMPTTMSRQTDSNKALLQLLCENCMWDNDLSESVTQRSNAKVMLIDISRKWDFVLNRPAR